MPDNIAVFATVILMLPMMYFLLAAPAFLLVGLDIPPVTQLLRGMFNSYLMALTVAGVIGMIAVAAEGRVFLTLAIGAVTAAAHWSRRWFVQQMNARICERDAGDADAVRQLRKLHWSGMLGNALMLGLTLASIPYVATMPA